MFMCSSSGERGMLIASLEGNYCRNPDKDKHGPWCFTNNSAIRWDYCNVSPCKCMDVCTCNTFRYIQLKIAKIQLQRHNKKTVCEIVRK